MAVKLGEAFVTIGTKDDKLKSGLSKAHGEVKSWADKTQKTVDSIGFGAINKSALAAAGGITVLGLSITSSLGKAVSVGMEFENSYFQMSKTFQSRTSEMVSQAQSMAEQFRHYYDVTEISYAFTKTADSMERYGITGERYISLVARAADVGAAKNLELKESIDRIESAMRGEAEASEYLGLTLNDTYMKNIAFGGQLQDVWEKLDDGTKAWYRYIEMMRQSTKYQGSATEATDTLSGSLKSLGGTIKDGLGPPLAVVGSNMAILVNWMNEAIKSGGALYNTVMFLSNGFKEMFGSAASSPTGGGGGWGGEGSQGSSIVRKAIPKATAFMAPPGGNKFLNKGGAKKSGGGAEPITLQDIDSSIERIKDRAVQMNDEFESMTNDLLQTIARNSGRLLDADMLEIEQWGRERNKAIWKDIEEAQRAYDELMQKLGGKRGATQEAQAAAVEAQAALERVWTMGDWSMDRTGELRMEKIAKATRDWSLEQAETNAQLRVDITYINGSLSEQLDAQLALLEAEKQRELAAAGTAEQQALITQKYEQQARLQDMQVNGSYLDGFNRAMYEYRINVATDYQIGKEFFAMAEDGFHGIGEALRDAITGTKDLGDAFSDLISRMADRAADLLMDKAFQQLMGGGSSSGSSGGGFDWLGAVMKIGGAVAGAFSGGSGGSMASTNYMSGSSYWADGGVITSPTMAVMGEGRYNEAVVPLPDGKAIPVAMKGSGGGGMKVSIHNYGGSRITAEQVSPDEIRIIAREESRKQVQKYAPSVIAADIDNPNGRTSVALRRNTSASRRLS